MRVMKKSWLRRVRDYLRYRDKSKFYIDHEPMILTGEAARDFQAAMDKRDREGNSKEQEAFLEECRQTRKKSKGSVA